MIKESELVPQEFINDEEIFEVLYELVRDADILAVCPQCNVPMSLEEYDNSCCSMCGEVALEDVLYVYREEDASKYN